MVTREFVVSLIVSTKFMISENENIVILISLSRNSKKLDWLNEVHAFLIPCHYVSVLLIDSPSATDN